jgi:predicted lipid-binding transport protein (Tim44 family)
MKLLSSVLVLSLLLGMQPAMASKRLGGGGSVGKQSSNVSQPSTPPSQAAASPGAPAQSASAATAAAKAPVAAAPAAVAQPKPWGAMLGGLAAGLGLAWLASSLGLGEAFGNLLMAGLLAMAVLAVMGWVMRSRIAKNTSPSHNLAYQGAAAGSGEGHVAKDYSPQNVGNDASARPWERNSMAFDASRFSDPSDKSHPLIGSNLPGTPTWGVPAGFDVEGFLHASKTNFVNLQAAWDRADMVVLKST